jgi:hypothetical protein
MNCKCPKVFGNRSAGRDNNPPIRGLQRASDFQKRLKYHTGTYPRAPPLDQAIGIYAYAWAKLVESVISTIILLITPILPFKAPFRARLSVKCLAIGTHGKIERSNLRTSPKKVLDRPKQYIEIDNPNNPVKMTGFRPMWSDIRLQWRTVRACVAKNRECYMYSRMRIYSLTKSDSPLIRHSILHEFHRHP